MSSRHLHDTVREGSLLDVSAPAGRFTFTGAEAESIVLIAGGVGITPLMSKIRYLTDCGWPGEIHLVFAVKTERDIIFRDELDYLRRRFPNLRVTVTTHPRRWYELDRRARQDLPRITEPRCPQALGTTRAYLRSSRHDERDRGDVARDGCSCRVDQTRIVHPPHTI